MADNKRYITQVQENGNVMISEDVVTTIVAHAAQGGGDSLHHTVGLFHGGGGVVQIDHGRMTLSAEVSFSTMTYILVMEPTACLPSKPK